MGQCGAYTVLLNKCQQLSFVCLVLPTVYCLCEDRSVWGILHMCFPSERHGSKLRTICLIWCYSAVPYLTTSFHQPLLKPCSTRVPRSTLWHGVVHYNLYNVFTYLFQNNPARSKFTLPIFSMRKLKFRRMPQSAGGRGRTQAGLAGLVLCLSITSLRPSPSVRSPVPDHLAEAPSSLDFIFFPSQKKWLTGRKVWGEV